MDSFYDQPRNAPKPTSVNKLNVPLIPEVSIIQPSAPNGREHRRPYTESYNVWKARNAPGPRQTYKENFEPNRQFGDPSARKQVRFESPALQRSDSSPCQAATFQRDEPSRNAAMRPLEEIYMANIPNRHLDLSILELPSYNKTISNDNNNPAVVNDQESNCYDIYNYKRGNSLETDEVQSKDDTRQAKTYADFKKQMNDNDCLNENRLYSRDLCDKLTKNNYDRSCCDNFTCKDNLQIATRRQNDDEPTTRDLLKVIQQQNEHILLLQKQVACLLETKANQKRIENPSYDPPNSPADKKPKKGPLSKIAIDVMTSFEVSFRPQNQNLLQRNKLKEIDDSPRIQEINVAADETSNVLDGIKKADKYEASDDVSLSFREPLKVIERCPSPEQSIHVDMQDYSSEEEDADSNLGWTLYNNIMGQVNNIFKNAQSDPQRPNADQRASATPKDKTLKRVKETTMKHLKSIGVNLPLIEESGVSAADSGSNGEFNSSDVSFAVKQLLMKYLPDEQLAKLTRNDAKRAQPGDNLIKRRPEFSFATVQYMKKYNLLASDGAKGQLPAKTQSNSQKILDVTALKQQPKLL